MMELSITGPGGVSPQTMQRILEMRAKELGETAKQSITATYINILKSLRARTTVAKKATQPKIEVADTGWYGGWSNSKNRPVVRSGASPYSHEVGLDKFRIAPNTYDGTSQKQRHVYLVTDERGRQYHLVAKDPSMALAFEKRLRDRRIAQHGGLARRAYGFGMAHMARATGKPNAAIDRILNGGAVNVHTQGNNSRYSIQFENLLKYCVSALKGGSSAVGQSVKAALNMTVGIVNRHLARHGNIFTMKKHQVPFPELKR